MTPTLKTNLKTKTICVVDNGLFVSFARMLAKEFGKVYYYVPYQMAFVRSQGMCVGEGFDDIERITEPLGMADKIDMWVFLDLYQADLQCYLEEHGARVWGGRHGEEMELFRWEFKQYLKKVGLSVQPCELVKGMPALREHLKKVKGTKFVKTSFVRGDFETFKHEDYSVTEPRLDEISHTLGPLKDDYKFIVEDEIPNAVEIGYDGFSVDGKFPSIAMTAIEIKDVGIVGKAEGYEHFAKQVKEVNTKLSKGLADHRYRGFLSTEVRVNSKGEGFLIDPCCRLGTPSNELLQELFEGWGEVLWNGAEGVLHDPRKIANYGVMAVIHSEWAVNDWLNVLYPKELERWIKLRMHTRIGGKDYIVPQAVGMPDVGGVVGVGKTMKEAIDSCKERAKQIKGFQVHVATEAIDRGLEQVEKARKMGVGF